MNVDRVTAPVVMTEKDTYAFLAKHAEEMVPTRFLPRILGYQMGQLLRQEEEQSGRNEKQSKSERNIQNQKKLLKTVQNRNVMLKRSAAGKKKCKNKSVIIQGHHQSPR